MKTIPSENIRPDRLPKRRLPQTHGYMDRMLKRRCVDCGHPWELSQWGTGGKCVQGKAAGFACNHQCGRWQ